MVNSVPDHDGIVYVMAILIMAAFTFMGSMSSEIVKWFRKSIQRSFVSMMDFVADYDKKSMLWS